MRMDLQPYGQPRPEVDAPPEWHFPTPEIHTLANGLTVWVYHRPGQYVVSASLVLDVPLDIEESDLEGIATISLHTLDEGTLDHPGTSYAEVLESSGAVFGGSVSLSATTCSVEMPAPSTSVAWRWPSSAFPRSPAPRCRPRSVMPPPSRHARCPGLTTASRWRRSSTRG